VTAEPITSYVITTHAAFEMARRRIDEETVHGVLSAPEQRVPVRPGRDVFQSRVDVGESRKGYLVRVFVDVDRSPPEVVTAYMTSRINKYWQEES